MKASTESTTIGLPSITRYAKVIPPMLTSSLATRVQMISPRTGASPGVTAALDQCCREVACAERLQVGVVREVGLFPVRGVNLPRTRKPGRDSSGGGGRSDARFPGVLQACIQLLVGGAGNSTARFRPACSSRSCMRRLYGWCPGRNRGTHPAAERSAQRLVSRTLPPTSSCRDSMKEARSSLDSSPCATRRSTRILMLTSRGHWFPHLRRLSIASVLRMTPLSAASDTTQLGEAEVTTPANNLGAQILAVDAQCVVSLVAHLCVGLGGGLHVGYRYRRCKSGRPVPSGLRKSARRCQLGDGSSRPRPRAPRGDLDGLRESTRHHRRKSGRGCESCHEERGRSYRR